MPLKNKKARAVYQSAYGTSHLVERRNYYREYRRRVLGAYSDGIMKCRCCGEGTYEFLSIDHIDGGGSAHRRTLGSKYIYSWLIQQGFPKGYQVLCHNCNMGRKINKGYCPEHAHL